MGPISQLEGASKEDETVEAVNDSYIVIGGEAKVVLKHSQDKFRHYSS
jgi:hypothetical protein